MIYQYEARGADKAITVAIDKHVDDERGQASRTRRGRWPGRRCDVTPASPGGQLGSRAVCTAIPARVVLLHVMASGASTVNVTTSTSASEGRSG
jgi:hypothetical protein